MWRCFEIPDIKKREVEPSRTEWKKNTPAWEGDLLVSAFRLFDSLCVNGN